MPGGFEISRTSSSMNNAQLPSGRPRVHNARCSGRPPSRATNVLKPKSDVNELESIENLLKSKFTEETETELADQEPTIEAGTVGIFKSFGDVKSLGVVLDPTALQLYEPCRYGFSCNDGTESLSDWSLVSEIRDFDFIKKRGNVYLCCKVSKSDLTA